MSVSPSVRQSCGDPYFTAFARTPISTTHCVTQRRRQTRHDRYKAAITPRLTTVESQQQEKQESAGMGEGGGERKVGVTSWANGRRRGCCVGESRVGDKSPPPPPNGDHVAALSPLDWKVDTRGESRAVKSPPDGVTSARVDQSNTGVAQVDQSNTDVAGDLLQCTDAPDLLRRFPRQEGK